MFLLSIPLVSVFQVILNIFIITKPQKEVKELTNLFLYMYVLLNQVFTKDNRFDL